MRMATSECDLMLLRKVTACEWLAAFGILLVGSLLASLYLGEWRERSLYEQRLAAFDPEAVPPLVLPADVGIVDAGEDLSGRWMLGGRWRRAILVFDGKTENDRRHYEVSFGFYTCTSGYSSELSAEQRGDRVWMSMPLAEGTGPIYQKFACIIVGTRRVLVPEGRSHDPKVLAAAIREAERGEWRGLQEIAYLEQ